MIRIRLILSLIIITTSLSVFAQRRVKYEILPYRNQMVLGDDDTLWVMKRRDILKLINAADNYRIYDQKIKILSKENEDLESQLQHKDSQLGKQEKLNSAFERDNKMKEEQVSALSQTLVEKEREIKKQKLQKNLTFIGSAAAILLLLLI